MANDALRRVAPFDFGGEPRPPEAAQHLVRPAMADEPMKRPFADSCALAFSWWNLSTNSRISVLPKYEYRDTAKILGDILYLLTASSLWYFWKTVTLCLFRAAVLYQQPPAEWHKEAPAAQPGLLAL
jgi:hypothetical protein